MQIITTGSIPFNPNWGILNLAPFQYLIDCSEEAQVITLPEINTLPPSGVQLLFRLTSDSEFQATLECAGEDDTFSNGTTNRTLVLAKGFTGSAILSVENGNGTLQWNITQLSNGLVSPIRITGVITQSSTTAPTIDIGEFIGDKEQLTLTSVYVGAGDYRIDFPANTFLNTSVTTIITPSAAASFVAFGRMNNNQLYLKTNNTAGVATNALLTKASFIIEINTVAPS